MIENLAELLILIVTIIIIGRVMFYRALLKLKNKMHKATDVKGVTDHTALIYSQEEIEDSMYCEVRCLFKNLMQHKKLNREQVLFIKNYLRNELKDYSYMYQGHYKNDAQEIYALLKSPTLNNYNYKYIVQVLKDFAKK